jgi:3D (Asp-Asp-Asp) domain-containing protein
MEDNKMKLLKNTSRYGQLLLLITCTFFIVFNCIQQQDMLSFLADGRVTNPEVKTLLAMQEEQQKIEKYQNDIIRLQNELHQAKELQFAVPVHITAYNPVPEQTDDTPFITASADYVRDGIVALSYDLESTLELEFGDIVVLETLDGEFLGEFEFQDRMNKRWRNKVDIFMWKVKDARKFGKVPGRMYVKRRQSVHRIGKDV